MAAAMGGDTSETFFVATIRRHRPWRRQEGGRCCQGEGLGGLAGYCGVDVVPGHWNLDI
jgi:hypothetical protein